MWIIEIAVKVLIVVEILCLQKNMSLFFGNSTLAIYEIRLIDFFFLKKKFTNENNKKNGTSSVFTFGGCTLLFINYETSCVGSCSFSTKVSDDIDILLYFPQQAHYYYSCYYNFSNYQVITEIDNLET